MKILEHIVFVLIGSLIGLICGVILPIILYYILIVTGSDESIGAAFSFFPIFTGPLGAISGAIMGLSHGIKRSEKTNNED